MAGSIPGCTQQPPVTTNDACRDITIQSGGINALFIGSTDIDAIITDVTSASQWETANTNGDIQAMWSLKATVGAPSETTAQLQGDKSEATTNAQRVLTGESAHLPYSQIALINDINANIGSYQFAYQVGTFGGTNYVRYWICGATGFFRIEEPDNPSDYVKVTFELRWNSLTELSADVMPSIDI